ncbi:hypothetical protein GYMLUDRAFT_552318 [Collybiopsis luxurians FD-317 M1]|uniref:Uncharacterized protein n=1 Tax=Collybiopsis luxurians FD-317 M1 TaxID=944289 RepID=A0A0D0CHM2_9AGAR|nr:hypothetical protein GYMLUDRAFT_552318 [Collybiopsis luxurians FD-317 M1]
MLDAGSSSRSTYPRALNLSSLYICFVVVPSFLVLVLVLVLDILSERQTTRCMGVSHVIYASSLDREWMNRCIYRCTLYCIQIRLSFIDTCTCNSHTKYMPYACVRKVKVCIHEMNMYVGGFRNMEMKGKGREGIRGIREAEGRKRLNGWMDRWMKRKNNARKERFRKALMHRGID